MLAFRPRFLSVSSNVGTGQCSKHWLAAVSVGTGMADAGSDELLAALAAQWTSLSFLPRSVLAPTFAATSLREPALGSELR